MLDKILSVVPQELFAHAKSRWHHLSALLISLLLALLFGIIFTQKVDLGKLSWANIGFIVGLLVLVWIVWLSTTRIRKAKKGTIGFAVAIVAEDESQRIRLVSDFIETLRGIIAIGHTEVHRYTFLVAHEYHARRIKAPEDAVVYMRKSRAQFLIFGRARLRELNGKPTHVLQLQGAILHHQLETMVQKKFSQEMGELFPAMCQFATENDLLAFELTASLISSVSRYIIGLASFLSGNIELAREQLETLERTLPNLGEGASPIQKIRSRLPMRLAGVYEAKATIEVHSWNLDRNLKHLDSARIALDAGLERNPNSYQMLLLSAICHFVLKRDLGAAVNAVRQCKDLAVRDGTWRFSYAFLLAYRGDYQQALQQYKAAFRSRYRPNIPIQVESFMLWVLEEEPERMELHYCLGMVNLHAKCDYVRAKEEFQAFLHKSGQSKSLRQWRGQASRYLAMIDAEIERGTLTQDDGVGASGSNEPRAPSEESSSPKRDSG